MYWSWKLVLNFTEQQKKFCLSLHYTVIYLLKVLKHTKSRQNNSEINVATLSLGNVSKDFSVDNTKYEFFGYIYDFAVDYDSINIADILDIHKYLMKKAQYKIIFWFI